MSAARARAAGPPGWLVLVVVGVAFWIAQRQIGSRAASADFKSIQTDRARLDPGVEWVDPRWEPELRTRLAAHADFAPDDGVARARLAEELLGLSFVAEVGLPEVVWPDGLRLDLRMRQPVACVPVGQSFYPVARDGTLLSGVWGAPPPIGPGHLPVLGPLDGACDDLRPGDVLEREERWAALATAASLLDHLDDADLASLGRATIDASRAALSSAEEPGTRVYLEGSRVVLFGRAANTGEPGELPVDKKWSSLSGALALLRAGELDWDLVDVRWDQPELRERSADERDG